MDDLFSFIGGGTFVVFLAIVIIVLLIAYLSSRYKVAGANEALIRSGRATPLGGGEAGLKVVRGQGIVVLPLFHKIGKLKLTARQINVNLADAVSRQGIKVAVQGVATFKIGADDESIRNAAERFLESEEAEVDSIVKNVLEGSLRSIVGTLTVEELNLDRQKFQQAVQDAAKGDLATSGLQIDSFTIQAIRDESGYMDLIGLQETARRERDARMAKASADQEAAVREAEANQVKINAERDVALRRAETETQIAAAEARAAQAGPLAQAEATQEVTRKQTELAELEAARKQQELIASTVRPAEAEADAQVKRAEGEKLARIAQAQAEAERVKLAGQAEASVDVTKGEANARVILVNAQSEAEKTKLEGNAEAGIVFTKGEAEAKALALRAEAYRQFNEAAIIQTVLSMLPEIVRAAAEPMANIKDLTVLSTDGASELVRNGTRTVAEASAVVKGVTGIDVPSLIGSALGDRGGGDDGGGGGSQGGEGGGGGGGRGRSPRPSAPRPSAPAPQPAGAVPASGTSGAPTPQEPAWGSRPATPPAGAAAPAAQQGAPATPTSEEVAAAQATAAEAVADAARRTGAPTMEQAQAAMGRADEAMRRAREATATAFGGKPEDVEPITTDTTINVAAQRLARDLQAIPGIERFGGLRLAELDRSGPRPLRTMWRIARSELGERYGEMTIGEVLDRYGPGASGGGSTGTHA
ncbi:MAG TPA: SPFH domain-containing protein [Candidatus Limnocylindrales bacterium]|nr:SPFH domain-containing protein [Candidatus Limnocylindrales bacterium]